MAPRPQQVLTPNDTALAVLWEDGHESFYPGPYLRKNCPCAPCKEEEPQPSSGLSLVQGSASPRYTLRDVHPVGSYALGVVWGDGHSTGIYSFEYLRSLCDCDACSG